MSNVLKSQKKIVFQIKFNLSLSHDRLLRKVAQNYQKMILCQKQQFLKHWKILMVIRIEKLFVIDPLRVSYQPKTLKKTLKEFLKI